MRLLFLVLILFVIWLFIKLISRIVLLLLLNPFNIKKLLENWLKANAAVNNGNSKKQSSAKMIKCARCQLYIPEANAYQYQGKFYCCEAHAKYQ